MLSCEIVRRIASLLDHSEDRLAVLTTCPPDNTLTQQQLASTDLPLDTVKLRKVKSFLDSITISTSDKRPGTMSLTVKIAQDILLRNRAVFSSSARPSCQASGHILILSADLKELADTDLILSPVQAHIICQGLPDYEQWHQIKCNGWKMTSDIDETINEKTGADRGRTSFGLSEKLQRLVECARVGRTTAAISDLIVNVSAGELFDIDSIMGDTRISVLHPGETLSVLVRIHSKNVPALSSDSRSPISQFDTAISGERLIPELEKMLSFTDMVALNVSISFKHPLLTGDTICVCKKELRILNDSTKSVADQVTRDSQETRSQEMDVQKALAHHIATHNDPRRVLELLEQVVDVHHTQKELLPFRNLLAKELRHQTRILNRPSLENSPVKSAGRRLVRVDREDPFIDKPKQTSPKDTNTAGLCSSKSTAKGAYNRKIENQRPIPLAEQLGLDDARRIWRRMQHVTTGQDDAKRRPRIQSAGHQQNETASNRSAGMVNFVRPSPVIRSFTAPAQAEHHAIWASMP